MVDFSKDGELAVYAEPSGSLWSSRSDGSEGVELAS
jgi:hypothetical protein